LGVFFIGGPGVLVDLNSLKTHYIIQKIADSGKPLGAICLATRILAQTGVLSGKKATGWNNDHKLKKIYDSYQVHYEKKAVVIDGKIITAMGPDSAQEFGKGIVALIS
jgi:putative intracellular protease/amidase